MPYITTFGIAKKDLRSTCYILACWFTLWHLTVIILGILSTPVYTTLVEPIVNTAVSILLMAGILRRSRWMLIPWILHIPFTMGLVLYFHICRFFGWYCFYDTEYPKVCTWKKLYYISFFMYYWLLLVLEILVFRYVLSYAININLSYKETRIPQQVTDQQ